VHLDNKKEVALHWSKSLSISRYCSRIPGVDYEYYGWNRLGEDIPESLFLTLKATDGTSLKTSVLNALTRTGNLKNLILRNRERDINSVQVPVTCFGLRVLHH